MRAIIKIVNLHFWKSITGPFFALGFPILFLGILGKLLGYHELIGSAIAIPPTIIGLTIFPTAIFEFRNSSLLKRVGVSKIKPNTFIFAISIFYMIIMFFSTFFVISFALVLFADHWNLGKLYFSSSQFLDLATNKEFWAYIYYPSMIMTYQWVNWGNLLVSIFINTILSLSIGLFVSSICKSTLSIQGVGIPILIISMFLASQILPISMVRDSKIIYNASYVVPFKYSTGLIINSWYAQTADVDLSSLSSSMNELSINFEQKTSIFSLDNFSVLTYYQGGKIGEKSLIFESYDKILNLIMPFIFSGIFFAFSIKTFKWSNK